MAAVIAAQQRRRNAPPAAVAAAEQLRDPRTVAVVTGQQAGLFGGPLYTLLKAITALRLAARVREEHHVPAVALFWADGEDHDWEEVRSCCVLDAEAGLKAAALPPVGRCLAPGGPRHPRRRHRRRARRSPGAPSPPPSSPRRLLDTLKRIYRPGAGMSAAFALLIEELLGPLGLVVYESSDPATKPFVADLFAKEIAMAGRLGAARHRGRGARSSRPATTRR